MTRIFAVKSKENDKPHSICFLPQCQLIRKMFFQSPSWKRHCVTHWHKQRYLDSYWQWQIRQSHFKISSNCGNKKNISPLQSPEINYTLFFIRICFITIFIITKSKHALWLVNQLWVIVPVNPRKNRASSELLYKNNRPQVSMGYRLINHLGCW